MSKRDQIIAHYEKKIAEYESRMNAAERLLLDLTPGGSEFHGSPERCAQWAQDRISFTGKLAAQRNQLRTAADALAAAMKELLEVYDDNEYIPDSFTFQPFRKVLRQYREANDG